MALFAFLVEKSIWVFEEIEEGIQLLVILIDVGFISLNFTLKWAWDNFN